MHVYLQAYEQGAASVPAIGRVREFLSVRKPKCFRNTNRSKWPTHGDNRVKTVPINFSIDLNQLPPGHYDCQVTVLNPTEQKGIFWQVPVMVVPLNLALWP